LLGDEQVAAYDRPRKSIFAIAARWAGRAGSAARLYWLGRRISTATARVSPGADAPSITATASCKE